MVFFSKQKKQVGEAKNLQRELKEAHEKLSKELKDAHEMQEKLQEEANNSEKALKKAQETRKQLQEEKKVAVEELAQERALLAEAEVEHTEKLKIEEKNKDADMAKAQDKELKAKKGINALEEESKSLHAEEKRLQTEIEKHKATLVAIQNDSGNTTREIDINVNNPLVDAASTDDEKLKTIGEERAKAESAREENENILDTLQTAIESANLATKAAEARYAEVAAELADEKKRAEVLESGSGEGNAKQKLEELKKQNAELQQEIADRDMEIEQAKKALEVANRNADAISHEMQRSNDCAKLEEELKTISVEESIVREKAESADKARKVLADEVAAAKSEWETRQKNMSADQAQWKKLLEESKKNFADAEERLNVVLKDKAWHEENLQKLVVSYKESCAQTEQVLKELAEVKKHHEFLPTELDKIKVAQERTKQEEVKLQKEHDGTLLQSKFHRTAVEAQLKEHEDIFNGAKSIPQALDNWRKAQGDLEEQLRNAVIEREGITGEIAGLEPVLEEANKMHADRVKALEEIQKDCAALREEHKTVALQEKAAADQLKDAKAAFELEETELRHKLQLAKSKLFEARQEHRQLKGELSTARGRLNVKANSYMQHREACADTVDSLRKIKRDTDMVNWLHGEEPRDLVHMAMQNPTPRMSQGPSSKLAGAGSSIFK